MPYSPSFVLDLHTEVDQRIKNVVDFAFLPGFNQPTVAVLFESVRTWTGCVDICPACCGRDSPRLPAGSTSIRTQ
jgi:hypothetical protein